MNIEYDPRKAESNLKKHGVSFDEAATVLLDSMALVRDDDDAHGEARYIALGMSSAGQLIAVCYTLRNEETIRLISARKATGNERMQYES